MSIVLIIALIAWVAALAANIKIAIEAFREDIAWGLGVLCIPCVSLIFVIKHWERTRQPFIVLVVATLVANIAGLATPSRRSRPRRAPASAVVEREPEDAAAPWRTPEPAPERPAPPAQRFDAATALLTVKTGQHAERLRALEEWLHEGLHRVEGARRDMILACGPHAGSDADQLLARSLREPMTTREALECVAAAPPATRKLLLARLTQRDPLVPSEEVARVLLEVHEDPEALVDETLVRIGHAREGCARRLIQARGGDWARTPEGKALLELVPLPRQLELITAEEMELRIVGMRLATTHGADTALEALSPLLEDPSHVMRQEAVQHLEALRDSRAAAPLVRALVAERDEGTRARIRRALGALASGETAQVFVGMLEDPAAGERLAAIAGIEATQPIVGIRALARTMRDADRGVAVSAVKTLGILNGSRAPGVKQAVEQLAPDLGRVATETKDAELKRLARKLYFDIRGRLPEQDRR